MTAAPASNLSRAKIQRLLQAVGSAPALVEHNAEAALYDWRDPHYFNEDQRNRLAALMTQVAALLSDRFAHFYKGEFDVRTDSMTPHFAGSLARQCDPNEGFFLPFGAEPEHPCGFLLVTSKVALDWAARLLGDPENNDDPDRAISSLEQSLLSDLLTAVVETFLNPLRGNQNLYPSASLLKGYPAMPYEATDEIYRVVFKVQQAEIEEKAELSFVLPCNLLAAAVGKAPSAEAQPSREQLTQLLMEHVQQMPVTVTVRLGATRLSFEEILDLGGEDILLIDKPIAEPVDVIIDGQIVFRGRPAQSSGRYAIYITECTTERTSPAAS